jgi:hypothetical protein
MLLGKSPRVALEARGREASVRIRNSEAREL